MKRTTLKLLPLYFPLLRLIIFEPSLEGLLLIQAIFSSEALQILFPWLKLGWDHSSEEDLALLNGKQALRKSSLGLQKTLVIPRPRLQRSCYLKTEE